ncbi:hypothetical protein ACDF64_01325 [Agromyces sp. MMS24-JH15]|uniref:hypothetical protein n=1 Tax=Agromyces sp. MMS24-JH15 TaxID=3243765 RepID=UPI003748178B
MRFLQKAVMPAREGAWLVHGNEVVCGYVVQAEHAAWADTPEKVFRLHGLGFDGSPLAPSFPFLDVVRIPITPYVRVTAATGGIDETGAALTGGAFIDHPPFTGTGFVGGVPEGLIPLWWLDPVRIPAGTELWRIYADAHEELVAVFPGVAVGWVAVGEYALEPESRGVPSTLLNVFGNWRGARVFVDELPDGRVSVSSFEELPDTAQTSRGLWAAEVDLGEVTEIAAVRFTCTWRGLPFQVIDRYTGDRARLVYLGRDVTKAEALQLTKTDAGVYEASVLWTELADLQGVELSRVP